MVLKQNHLAGCFNPEFPDSAELLSVLIIYVFHVNLLLTNLVEASRRGARSKSHGCLDLWECSQTRDAGAAQTQNKMDLPLQDQHNSPLPWRVGMKIPQEAGRWTGHPSSTFPTTRGWLAVVVCMRDGYGLENQPVFPSWNEPPLVTFHKSCSSSGQMCNVKQMGRERYNLVTSAQLFWQRDLKP